MREARKSEQAKADSKEKDKDKGTEKDKDKEKEKEKGKHSDDKETTTSVPNLPTSTGSQHKKYTLHRQIFEMRLGEIKRREMGNKAREVGKGLPQVPRGMFWCVLNVHPCLAPFPNPSSFKEGRVS